MMSDKYIYEYRTVKVHDFSKRDGDTAEALERRLNKIGQDGFRFVYETHNYLILQRGRRVSA